MGMTQLEEHIQTGGRGRCWELGGDKAESRTSGAYCLYNSSRQNDKGLRPMTTVKIDSK